MNKAYHKETKVGLYVTARQAAVSKRLSALLDDWMRKLAKKVAKAYERLAKAEDDVVQQILDAVSLEGFSIDLVDELTPSMIQAFRDGGVRGLMEVKLEETDNITKQMDAKALAYAEERSTRLIKDFADSTQEHLRSVITRGIAEGMSTTDLSDAVQESGAFGEYRADMIARTELAFAHVQGNVEGWRQSGEVTGKRSILGDLHDVPDVCDDCVDAGTVGMDEDFVVGYDFPPYHPNCCCDISPVLSGEEDQGDEE